MRHPFLEVHASDVDGCLARLKATLIDGKDTDSTPAKVGTLVHRVAEVVAKVKAASPAADLLPPVRDAIRTHAAALGLSPAGVADAVSILEKSLAPDSRVSLWIEPGWTGRTEYRWGLVEDGDDVVFVENPWPGVECIAAGTIDRVEWTGGALRVRDYKTKVQMLTAQSAWDSFQLRLYTLAMFRALPEVHDATSSFVMLRHGYEAGANFLRGDPWEAATLLRVREVREVRRRALESGEFPEQLGPWCDYCPIMAKCGAQREAAEMGNEAVAELSIEDAARMSLGLASRVALLKRRVRSWVDAHDTPIPLGDPHGQVLGYAPSAGWETLLPYERTIVRLREYGMTNEQEIERFRFVARHHFAGAVRKMLGELGVHAEEAESLVTPIAKQRFAAHVPEPTLPMDRLATMAEIDEMVDEFMD